MWKTTVAGIAILPRLSSLVINMVEKSKTESTNILLVLIQIDNPMF
jgi:hypothetical protein